MTPIVKGKSTIMWGTCTSGPHVRTFDNGKVKTVFSLRYNQTRNADGEKVSDYIDVESWGQLAKYASCVERGDDLFVAGEYAKDVYRSEKKGEDIYVIKASIILAQPVADEIQESEEEEPPADDLPEEWTKPKGGVDISYEEQIEAADGELPY